jgi:UPF0716 protein FxsA
MLLPFRFNKRKTRFVRNIIFLLLLAFPITEIVILVKLFQAYGIWVLFYLVAVGLLGLQLIKEEKLLFSARMMQGGSPFKAIFGSARNLIAGVLLIIPGVLTDIIATILLLIPLGNNPNRQATNDANYGEQTQNSTDYDQPPSNKSSKENVIEGEFRRED